MGNSKTEFGIGAKSRGKVAPEDAGLRRGKTAVGGDAMGHGFEEEDEHLKTEEDEPDFIRKLGTEPYITFAEFAKYLSLFNPKTGLDEKIQCRLQ